MNGRIMNKYCMILSKQFKNKTRNMFSAYPIASPSPKMLS